MAALRELDRQPGLAIEQRYLDVGARIKLVPEADAARSLWPAKQATPDTEPGPPPLYWFSRVAYTADGRWALVYAAQVCPGITPKTKEESETGAYEAVFLAALQWQRGKWILHKDLLFLDIGLPRVRASSAGARSSQN